MTAVAERLIQGTEAWRLARRSTIGSSDIPVITGESPYKSALELWLEKTGQIDDALDSSTAELMAIGHHMEPVLLWLYEARTGRKARRVPALLRHPEVEWATASLDARAGRRAVELKWTHSLRWRAARGSVPDDVEQQVQWQLFVTGWEEADVVVLDGPEARVIPIRRDQAYIDNLFVAARDFHELVELGQQPGFDGSESSRRALTRIYPRPRVPMLAADEAFTLLAREIRDAQAGSDAAEARLGTAKNAMRAALGDAAGVEGPGFKVTWSKNADSQEVGWAQVAAAYRTLAAQHVSEAELATVQELFTVTREGPRVLRTTFK